MIEEFEKVIQYPRLNKNSGFKENASALLENVKIFGVFFSPQITVDLLKDKSDNKFLELALEAKADYLITGNHKDFTITEFKGTAIINPQQFCELYEQNKL